jgi:hypothetical protein
VRSGGCRRAQEGLPPLLYTILCVEFFSRGILYSTHHIIHLNTSYYHENKIYSKSRDTHLYRHTPALYKVHLTHSHIHSVPNKSHSINLNLGILLACLLAGRRNLSGYTDATAPQPNLRNNVFVPRHHYTLQNPSTL